MHLLVNPPPVPSPPASPLLASVREAGDRQAAQALIRDCFAREHQARMRQFMPHLLALRDDAGHLLAAVGYRCASHEPLFLERYLDAPIEQVLASRLQRDISRSQVVEVGNLATTQPGQARRLIVALTTQLAAQDLRWVTFTATRQLANSFRRLGLAPQVLTRADPARLGDDLADWGTYYDSDPQVMAGEIPDGLQRLVALGRVSSVTPVPLAREAAHVGCH